MSPVCPACVCRSPKERGTRSHNATSRGRWRLAVGGRCVRRDVRTDPGYRVHIMSQAGSFETLPKVGQHPHLQYPDWDQQGWFYQFLCVCVFLVVFSFVAEGNTASIAGSFSGKKPIYREASDWVARMQVSC